MIKFRAWNGYRKIMADYVSAIQNGDTQGTPSSVNVIVDGKNETWDIKNDDVELLKFTGLKDVNGKEIYEGDIVHVVTGDGYRRTGKVIFEQEQGCYMVDNGWDKYPFNRFGYERDTLEVLGEVHENPELLEEDK
ncbi:YopX family protein [Lactiplantibacillus plantarum]|uniref:YopX family protein n=1 Tax=Lactiplantibacillus plantarum TaxID=1590 RepID=UPI001C0146E6|nr:YopX family protein [Lactiplantibacillus plantarum]MBT9656769.1 hypothetical protein [Lactiplantibacillus plantarum]